MLNMTVHDVRLRFFQLTGDNARTKLQNVIINSTANCFHPTGFGGRKHTTILVTTSGNYTSDNRSVESPNCFRRMPCLSSMER